MKLSIVVRRLIKAYVYAKKAKDYNAMANIALQIEDAKKRKGK